MVIDLAISGLLAIAGYFLGSIPTGYLIVKALTGLDIREQGSGSTGATNVLRTAGKPAAIAVLLIDILKGAAAPTLVKLTYALAPNLLPTDWQPWLVVFAALTAVLGHSKSIWLNFRGGKSVASGLGVLLAIAPLVAVSAFGVFLGILAIARIVSLGSILAALSVTAFMLWFGQPLAYCIFGAIAGIYVIVRHRSNIERLLAGTEPRIGQKLATETVNSSPDRD